MRPALSGETQRTDLTVTQSSGGPHCAASVRRMTEISAKGIAGSVHFDGDFVTIKRSMMSTLRGETRIPVAMISAVRFSPGKLTGGGMIEFVVAGGKETVQRKGRIVPDGRDNPNAILLSKGNTAEMSALRDAVEAAIAVRHSAAPTPTVPNQAATSIPEQIKQLADLRDSGILTEDEFQAAKADLLAQM